MLQIVELQYQLNGICSVLVAKEFLVSMAEAQPVILLRYVPLRG